MKKYLLNILLFFILPLVVHAQDGFIQLKTAIHVSSVISDGKYTLSEIVRAAKKEGIEAVIFTDRDLRRWEYGVWPLRNIIKRTVEENSILKYGAGNYLDDIQALQEQYSDMIFVPGVESAPFYYWRGSAVKCDFAICDWHKHILAVGMEDPRDYEMLPVIGNRHGLADGFDIFKLWPVLLFPAGAACLRKRKCNYKDCRGKELGAYSRPWRACGMAMIISGVLLFINNWPFAKVKFDQYHGDLKEKPYQNFINYVNGKNGLTFWVHPEEAYVEQRGSVHIETKEYTRILLDTKDYTGFAVFYGGYNIVGKPGGLWDEILKEYCRGVRARPVWAIAGVAFDYSNDLTLRLKDLKTIVLVTRKNKAGVREALKTGRMYVVSGARSRDFTMDNFSVSDITGQEKGFMGDTVLIKDKPRLHIEGSISGAAVTAEVAIIRDGKTIKNFKVATPFKIIYNDDGFSGGNTYYRLEIKGSDFHALANPVFVRRE